MALVPIRIDRTSKPPMGIPLRSDGHWSVQGLVGAWAFNEGAGRKAQNTVNGAFGSLSNIVYGADCITNSGSGYVDCGNVLGGLSRLTVVAKVLCANSSATRQIISKGYNGSGTEWQLYFEQTTGKLVFDTYAGSNYGAKSSDYVVGKQITAAGSYDGSTWRVYVDGKLSGQADGTGPSSCDRKLMIGAVDINGTPGQFFSGNIWQALVYNIALSPAQIASLSTNPWQIYEPELVWIEVPDGAGATHTSSANPGTVALTGSVTTTYHTYVSSADTGSVTLTGSTASDYYNRVSSAATGTVTITGNAATDYRGLVSHAGAGSVILAGSTSTDYRNLVSSADTSTVTLTGYAAMDTITGAGSYTSNAEAGSITLSGVTTTNYRTLISGAGTGAVTVTGFTATDTVTAAGAYTSEAAAGTILLTGLPVTSHRSSVADSSAIQIVGSDATGYFGFTSGAEPSAVIITGAETSVLRTWISDAIPGSIVIHGYETSGISPIYEISKIFATARLSGPSATGRITTPTTGIRLT